MNHNLSKSVADIFDDVYTWNDTLKKTSGKASYVFWLLSCIPVIISIFSNNPNARAAERGVYVKLKSILKIIMEVIFYLSLIVSLIMLIGGYICDVVGEYRFEKMLSTVGIAYKKGYYDVMAIVAISVFSLATFVINKYLK